MIGNILRFVIRYKTALVGALGLILGLILGLVYAWNIAPVEFVNAPPARLRADFQENYIRWVVSQYALDRNVVEARRRLGADYWDAADMAATLTRLEGKFTGQELADLRALKEALAAAPTVTPGAPQAGGGGGALLSPWVCVGTGLLVLAVAGAVVYLLLLRPRARPTARQRVAPSPRERLPVEEVSWGEEGPPLAQFVTSYSLGDDHYDPSFSIELENGEFMGECGVGISEIIGAGLPDKVTAFEVWLFDKSDIRTVTKVLMSEYAFHDEALRAKLAPKGEPVLVEIGKDVVLETKTLRLRARVAEATYEAGNLPPRSYFGKFTVELAAWTIEA